MNVFLRRARLVGFTAALLLWAGIATAPVMAASVPITFTFTGKVTYVGREMGENFKDGPFTVGKPARVSYIFNQATPDSKPLDKTMGQYNNALTKLDVEIGTSTGTYGAILGSGDNKIVVRDPDNSNYESYQVKGVFSGDDVTDHDPKSFELKLAYPGSDQFGDDSLRVSPPSISAFAVKEFRLVFAHKYDEAAHTVIVTFDTPVPLPPARILFGAGLVALIGLGARNRWRKTV